MDIDDFKDSEKADILKNILISCATGGECDDNTYKQIRRYFLSDKKTRELLPRFVVTCTSLDQFWQYIKRFKTYQDRRIYIYESFENLMAYLEGRELSSPNKEDIEKVIRDYAEGVYIHWKKALERARNDPGGAVTAARSLLEATIKHILDDLGVSYDDRKDVLGLYKILSKQMRMSPESYDEKPIKQILSGAISIVYGMSELRNKISDSHGQGKRKVYQPAPRHAFLAVNVAGAICAFLIETYKERFQK